MLKIFPTLNKINSSIIRNTARQFIHWKRKNNQGMLSIKGFQVYPWSISGLETTVVVGKKDIGLDIVFDMGYSCRDSVRCPLVFISHGHMDHISAIPQHASKRSLSKMKPAQYYMAKPLIEGVRKVMEACEPLHQDAQLKENVKLEVIEAGKIVKIHSKISVSCFPTIHRVPSQGYIVYHNKETLKPEYSELTPKEIGDLCREGVNVKTVQSIPQVAYTGDTTFDVFLSPYNEDLLKAKLLITEATYIDNDTSIEKAKEYGHIHYQQIVDNAHLFNNVEAILLIHFSDKYSAKYIQKHILGTLPDCLKEKVHLGLVAKEISYS